MHALQALASGAHQIITAIPVQQRDSSLLPGEILTHPLGVIAVLLELFLEQRKQPVVRSDELLAVGLCDLRQAADHPANGLELPFVRRPNEPIIRCDIRKERKLPAALGAKITLALRRTQAGEQEHVPGRVCFELRRLRRGLLTLIPAPLMPEIGAGLKIAPLALIRRRDRLADVAAEGLAAGIMRRAHPAAIQFGDGRVEPII